MTVMVTFTGSLSSPGGGVGLTLGVGVAPWGDVVRGEAARGKAMVGPGKKTAKIQH